MRQNSTISKQDILEYAQDCGAEAAANLLLLGGPDGYAGDYDEYKELEAMLEAMLEAKACNKNT